MAMERKIPHRAGKYHTENKVKIIIENDGITTHPPRQKVKPNHQFNTLNRNAKETVEP